MHLSLFLQYGIVMDAGSTHTALYVYRWLGDPANRLNGTGVVKQIASDSCGEKGKQCNCMLYYCTWT